MKNGVILVTLLQAC